MLELKKQDIERLEKYPMRCQEGLMEEAEVVMTIFNPYGAGAWHILEAQKLEDDDWYFFGYVESPITPDFNEYGPFTFKELQQVKIPIRIKDIGTGEIHDLGYGSFEIDRSLKDGTKLKEVLN